MTPKEQQIVYLKNLYNANLGVPKTSMQVASRMVDMGRQMGKTRIMIETLPEDGSAIIVVWGMREANHIKTMIGDVRGRDYPTHKLSFVSFQEWRKDPYSVLRGFPPLPAFVDNTVYDMLAIETAQSLCNFFNPERKTCDQSTPTTTASSERTSRRSRTKSKRSAIETT